MDIARFRTLPLLGILRDIAVDDVAPLAETVAAAGLEAVEITMNTAGAPALIRQMVSAAGGRFEIYVDMRPKEHGGRRMHYSDGADLVDDVAGSRRSLPEAVVPMLEAIDRPLVVRERCRLRRLRVCRR